MWSSLRKDKKKVFSDTNLLKNPLSHHDTPVFCVNFTFKLIIAGSDTINGQIFQSWFNLKVELGKRINLVSDWEEGLTQSKWQSQWVMVQPSGRIGLTSVRRRLHLMLQRTTSSGWCTNIETESINIIKLLEWSKFSSSKLFVRQRRHEKEEIWNHLINNNISSDPSLVVMVDVADLENLVTLSTDRRLQN